VLTAQTKKMGLRHLSTCRLVTSADSASRDGKQVHRPDMTTTSPTVSGSSNERLGEGMLGTAAIVFMVMAVSAPLAVVVALMPIAFASGNGAGVPGTWLLCAGAMLMFAIGYVRIIPFVRNAGAFYAYISAGFGRTLGLAAAYVAMLSYFTLCVSTAAALAFFCADFVQRYFGVRSSWELWAAAAIFLVAFLAFRKITLAATVLSFVLAAEITLILALSVAVAIHRGVGAFNLRDFSLSTVFSPGIGIGLIYAFNSLIGFEGTAIYQEEARRRSVTIPRATYISAIAIGLFYVIAAWSLSTAVGSDKVASIARKDPGHFVASCAAIYLGPVGVIAVSTMVLSSAFAATLGLFNNTTRYMYALARDGVLPRYLAKTHPTYRSPHIAGVMLAGIVAVVMFLSAAAGLDPLLNISTSLVGLGSVGLMALLAITSLAIPFFFGRQGQYGIRITLAPAVGAIVIAIATYLAVVNYPALTGVTSQIINSLPWLLVGVVGLGIGQALWLRSKRPAIYGRIGLTRVEEDAPSTASSGWGQTDSRDIKGPHHEHIPGPKLPAAKKPRPRC
jgi:amino acid transporter